MGRLLAWLLVAGEFGKMLTTGGTMLLSMLAYSWIFGWRYAVGFVLLIFVHEMGHYLAARKRGLAVGAPTFIPFVGAWIEMKDMPHDVETEAFVGFAGPLAGGAERRPWPAARVLPGAAGGAGELCGDVSGAGGVFGGHEL